MSLVISKVLLMHWEQRFSQKASTQEGLIAKFQVRELGFGRNQWRRAIDNGRWLPRSGRVLAAAAAPPTDAQRVMAAVLDASPGAALHGPSVLAWCGFPAYDLRRLTVARPRGMSSAQTELADLHELRALLPGHVLVHRGVVCEHPLRAIWTEAAHYAPERRFEIGMRKIGRLLDWGNKHGFLTWAGLHSMVDDIHQRGRAGTVLMRALAGERPPGSSPAESQNETQFEKLLADAGEGSFLRQRVLGGHDVIGRADFADEELPLAIEVNSMTFHTTPTDRADDELRYRRLLDAGFTVGVPWDVDLWSRPSSVLRLVREVRRLAALGERTVLHSPGCPWPDPVLGARMRA